MSRALWFGLGWLCSLAVEAAAVLAYKARLDRRYDARLATAFAPDEVAPPEWVNDAALGVQP